MILLQTLVSLNGVHTLYEDQVSKFDWRSRFVGHLTQLSHIKSSKQSSDTLWQTHNTIVFSTGSHVFASVYIRNGTIQWRHLLESPIDLFVATKSRDCPLVTINGLGVWIRCWTLDGLIVSENSLSNDYIEDIENNNLSPDSTQITVSKFDLTQQSLELFVFDLKSQSSKSTSTPISTSNWMTESTSCSFQTSKYLICIDDRNLTLQYLIVGESKSFSAIPLSAFGLQSDNKPKYLRLQSLPHQENSESPYFAVNLGGDGFVLLRAKQKQIDLIKVFPKVSAITLAPIIDSTDVAVCTLVTKANPNTGDGETTDSPTPTTGIKIAAFDMEKWSEVSSLSSQFILNNHIIVDKLEIIPLIRSDNKHNYKILISSEDSTLIMTNLLGRTTWRREEALSSISSAEQIDLPLSELDAKIEQTFNLDGSNIFTLFITRISTQVYQFQTYTASLVKQLIASLSQKPIRHKSSDNLDDESIDNSLDSAVIRDNNEFTLIRDRFGLHKVIIALAANGKLFAIDSLTGAIIWSIYEPFLSHSLNTKNRPTILVQRSTAHYPYPAKCTIVNKNGFIFSFDPITGQVLERIKLEIDVSQTMLLSHTDSNHLKPILILDDKLKPIIYPSSAKSLFLTLKDIYYMLVTNEKNGSVKGLSFADSKQNELIAKQIWAVDLPVPLVGMQAVFKRYGEHVHSQGRVMGDRNVLYKYLNPNLVAIVGESVDSQERTFVVFYLMDSITGSVVYTTVHKRAKRPIHIIHSENWIIYSYYNEKSRRTEISSIELFEGETQSNSSAFSSLTRNQLIPAIVEQNSFIFPTGIDVMADTITERGITIFLPSGGLLELPKAFLDPRRPLKPTPEHMEEGLIPYIPEIPIPAEGIINYNKTLTAIRGIQTSATGLESTCLVFAYGLDLFYTRVTPSKTFDVLKDDFDFILISVVLIALIAFSYAIKWLAARKALNASWK
ncbi:unnamed protein product [Medioppia subpectinata]|uniref:ER membrane protein complex subunit 1 n=1 Tax=Medioppia subpectinata TaxID=1979941 RepID=A0A7R9L0D9_9ACAR|nr:unnamed protein product [Medioppia subpectinata]CAG2112877.1 unnamed protein product [Medioppia subpectinata]